MKLFIREKRLGWAVVNLKPATPRNASEEEFRPKEINKMLIKEHEPTKPTNYVFWEMSREKFWQRSSNGSLQMTAIHARP